MGKFLLLLTNLAFPFAAVWVLLGFVFSPRRRVLKTLKQELKERFALEPESSIPQQALWVHCASVGEVRSARGFIDEIKKFYKKEVIVTASTAAGRAEAAKNSAVAKALLVPLDFYPFSRRFIARAHPYRLFVVEREIWPNMLAAAHQAGVPVLLINARISQKSTRAYKWVRPLFAELFSRVAVAALQEEDAAQRYISLGLPQACIRICGNMKYDTLNDQPAKLQEIQQLIKQLKWQKNAILVCGSTHPLEEDIIFKALSTWAAQGIKVIFAPRHLERVAEIKATLQAQSLSFGMLSDGTFPSNCAVLCVDQMGWLQAFYAIAALTFVGGSIAPRGAHNLLEPAILKKTVLFGKSFYNTPDTAHALLSCGGGVLVDQTNFQDTVLRLIKDPAALDNMSAKARKTAVDFKGATQKIMEAVKAYERKTA